MKSTFEDANNYMKDGVYLRQVIDVIDEIEFDDVKETMLLVLFMKKSFVNCSLPVPPVSFTRREP